MKTCENVSDESNNKQCVALNYKHKNQNIIFLSGERWF